LLAGFLFMLEFLDWKTQLGNLKPEAIKVILTVLGGWLLHRLTTKSPDLVTYMSHLQTVNFPPQQNNPAVVLRTFSLYLWNQGKAPALGLVTE